MKMKVSTGKNIHIYWLQFFLAAVWVGVFDVVLSGKLPSDIRRLFMDFLVVMTGVTAFRKLDKHILKYALVSFCASLLIQVFREVGHWYMSLNPTFWRLGGPILILAAITIVLIIVGALTNKDKMRV
jgi:hypothetical protein